jgi:hypothetical protein
LPEKRPTYNRSPQGEKPGSPALVWTVISLHKHELRPLPLFLSARWHDTTTHGPPLLRRQQCCFCCRLETNAPFISLLSWTEVGLKWAPTIMLGMCRQFLRHTDVAILNLPLAKSATSSDFRVSAERRASCPHTRRRRIVLSNRGEASPR